MKFAGDYRIDAPREKVWAALNDPEVMRRCVPGCEEIVRDTPTDWQARVAVRVGPVRARFAGRIRLEDLDPPAGCRIVGEGSGGAAGFASGGAVVRLAADGDATLLTYEADAQIGGKLAQIGSRLIDSFAKRYADDFFATFARIVGGGEAQAVVSALDPALELASESAGATAVLATGPAARPAERPAPPPPAPVRRGGFDPQAFTIVVLALLLVFMTVMYALKP